jgi:hypothetical protein
LETAFCLRTPAAIPVGLIKPAQHQAPHILNLYTSGAFEWLLHGITDVQGICQQKLDIIVPEIKGNVRDSFKRGVIIDTYVSE